MLLLNVRSTPWFISPLNEIKASWKLTLQLKSSLKINVGKVFNPDFLLERTCPEKSRLISTGLFNRAIKSKNINDNSSVIKYIRPVPLRKSLIQGLFLSNNCKNEAKQKNSQFPVKIIKSQIWPIKSDFKRINVSAV